MIAILVAVIGGLLGLAGIVYTTTVQRRMERDKTTVAAQVAIDKAEARAAAQLVEASVKTSHDVLDAWKDMVRALGEQIKDLHAQLRDLETRERDCQARIALLEGKLDMPLAEVKRTAIEVGELAQSVRNYATAADPTNGEPE